MRNITFLKNPRLIVMLLAGIGIWLAMYLYFEYATQNLYGVCNINSIINCAPITTGSLATFFGIPVALIGLMGYVSILLTAYFRKFNWTFYMACFGMAFCVRLLFLEIFIEKVICPICVACQIVMLAEFVLSYRLKDTSRVI